MRFGSASGVGLVNDGRELVQGGCDRWTVGQTMEIGLIPDCEQRCLEVFPAVGWVNSSDLSSRGEGGY